jgi:hypothetical protein
MMSRIFILACLAAASTISAQESARIASGNPCLCDPAKPETMKIRQCSLCNEAEKHSTEDVFFLKDINPRKPNRWLALPNYHGDGPHHLHDMPHALRTKLFQSAITKATELFGEGNWGLAYNGEKVRTQCHTHLHMGKFLTVAERKDHVITVSRAADIPVPAGEGIWVHPVGKKFHVHLGEQITETVLLR